ncbi:hypothetical protein CAOG_01438 [Capsaspora owczarzaki ATCC 30864]|uniref:Cap-specific mRNA (nucleoside-2'-O-)-methyltransferase n=1 Tax=Capsaspora owczarzaki (strain ATCC 30864) TaxID=595528 RepID=A0A0D2WKF8_CAPO3|nr:hypothetical protein CAOG_01438 [Capsaspora owczarzaki ATCC 30864]KJE90063.1 hypothetical protein CAOG_001438 [Capsaspora owczarzaki ATCC 30864]|eukprot:XP_004364306.1 hypothetical protein CAOG_01438 [Capsaspora owczarzaki ATCC 30864]
MPVEDADAAKRVKLDMQQQQHQQQQQAQSPSTGMMSAEARRSAAAQTLAQIRTQQRPVGYGLPGNRRGSVGSPMGSAPSDAAGTARGSSSSVEGGGGGATGLPSGRPSTSSSSYSGGTYTTSGSSGTPSVLDSALAAIQSQAREAPPRPVELPLHLNERANPHIAQVWLNQGYESRRNLSFHRTLRPDAPRMAYRRRKHETKSVIHWGERKMLMSEIEFLSLYGTPDRLVVYAGAAPGGHMQYLASFFPHLKFVGVDPAPFKIKQTEQISFRQQYFSNELAQEFLGKGVLFISDIRSPDDEIEAQAQADMAAQMRWHEIMQPHRSMLKFRLPWNEGQTMYLDGEVYLPVWGPITTTEARLVTHADSTALRAYDNKTYEEQMFFFNTVQRVALYEHPIRGQGIDCCYDCRAEVEILGLYLQQVRKVDPVRTVAEISRLSAEISKNMGTAGRTLASPNSDPEERKQLNQRGQWGHGWQRPYASQQQPPQQPPPASASQSQVQQPQYQQQHYPPTAHSHRSSDEPSQSPPPPNPFDPQSQSRDGQMPLEELADPLDPAVVAAGTLPPAKRSQAELAESDRELDGSFAS